MGDRLRKLSRLLFGDHPRALFVLLWPTGLALALDLGLRASVIASFALKGKLIFLSSLLVGAAFWWLPSWGLARAFVVGNRSVARLSLAVLSALWLVPFATFSFAGQALYYRVFHSYMGRDTLRLGIALRGTVGDWMSSWGGPWLIAAMVVVGAVISGGVLYVAKREAPRLAGRVPLLPVLTFVGSLICAWTDNIDSRFLQAALPDACFEHAVVHAAQMALTGKWTVHQGYSIRRPAPLPPLVATPTSPGGRPRDVVVILTESVRADAVCSESQPSCTSRFLDDVARDRVSLGALTTQTPNTFSSCMILWTGLPPTVDFLTAHAAPVLWELARAVGYRTAYVTSQNPKYEDFGAFVQRAGIEHLVTGAELGGLAQEQLGANDEDATKDMLAYLRSLPDDAPSFAVLHLSNTHSPYRIDESLQPFAPSSPSPLGGIAAFHNRYRNAVAFQERTISAFLRELEAMPRWQDTVVVFLSDHGEQFREHGGLYHNHSLYDEELRVPGFVLAGPRGLDDGEKKALQSYAGQRTFTQDVHETLVDLLGLDGSRARLPFASLVTGRSLLRPRVPSRDPVALLATSTSVWEPDDARFGVMHRERLLMGAPVWTWACFDLTKDPGEHTALPAASCPQLLATAKREFASAGVPP